jgi:hypothetical protein
MKKVSATQKALLISAVVIVVAGGGFATYEHFHSSTPVAKKSANPVYYNPPTPQDKADTQARKEALAKQYQQQQSSPQPSPSKQAVTPVITNASQIGQQITVNAYVSGIFEDGGICTASFTQGSLQVTKNSTAFANATTTDCPPIVMNSSEFSSKGNWQVTVAYNSAKATGTSQPETLTVR